MAVTPTPVLDSHGVDTLLLEVFQTVEDHYIRRSVAEAAIAELEGRIEGLEKFENVRFEIVGSNLNAVFSDDADATNLSIDNSGNLIMVTTDPTETDTEKDLENYAFSINSDGVLTLTIS